MSICFGGVDYTAGDVTDYIYTKRKEIAKQESQENAYKELFWFLPNTKEFCSCLLYENLINMITKEISPNLDYALAHSRYIDEEWYKNLCILNHQMEGWPLYREKHILSGNYRPHYWELIGLKNNLTWYKLKPTPENINVILAEEEKMRDAVHEFEIKLYDLIAKLGTF